MRWAPVVGWEGFYEVNTFGDVRSVAREVVRSNGTAQRWSPKMLGVVINTSGYPAVRLSRPGRRHMARVHRLVAEAFIPNPQNKPEVNHLDGNKLNPALGNLEWVTSQENRQHAWRTGLRTRDDLPVHRGENNSQAKLTEEAAAEIRRRYDGGDKRLTAMAREFGVHKKTIYDVTRRNLWLPAPPTKDPTNG